MSNLPPLRRASRVVVENGVLSVTDGRGCSPRLRTLPFGSISPTTPSSRRFRIHLSWPAEGNGPWGDLTFGSDYRLASNRDDLRSVFIEALLDTDLDRFRRCPVCQHFFYRIRSDNKGDGCSDDCNNTLRQQRWRSNKAKQPRKFKAKQSPKLKLVR